MVLGNGSLLFKKWEHACNGRMLLYTWSWIYCIFDNLYCWEKLQQKKKLFSFPVLRNIQKCTNAEGQQVTSNVSWSVTVAYGIISGRNLPIKRMWNSFWECPVFSKTMSHNWFLDIMRYLSFYLKTERKQNLISRQVLSSILTVESFYWKLSEGIYSFWQYACQYTSVMTT